MPVNPSEIIVAEQDFYDAEDFLVRYLSEQIPEASFERGSALRDFAVSSFVLIYAYLRGEAEGIRTRQSAQAISEAIDNGVPDLDQSLDQILSNWFLTRKTGTRSRATAQMHFTKKQNYSLPSNIAFWRDFSHAFYLDVSTDPYVIASSSLLPSFDTFGNLIDYVAEVPLIAANTGSDYEYPPGRFAKVVTPVGNIPNLSYVEHQVASSVANTDEDAAAYIARSQTAIAVRNLINNRSVAATIGEEFPDVESTLTIGMGEPEMRRDLITELGSHIRLHVGGHYDTFLESPDQSVEEYGLVGGYFPRADEIANVFRDPKMTIDEAFPFTSIVSLEVGHVIYIRDGILNSPRGYQIIRIEDHELYVSEAMPFTEASDETGEAVEYSIGWHSPDFDDADLNGTNIRIAEASTTPGYEHVPPGTSRHIQSPGTILLRGRPVLDVTLVEIVDPTGADSSYVDPSRGTIVFPTRVNGVPPAPGVPPVDLSALSYRIEVLNSRYGQSAEMVTRLTVGWDGDLSRFDDRTVRVTYLTASDFANVADYAKSYDDRVVAANHLMRMRHPIWIEVLIPYRLKPTASDDIVSVDVSTSMSNYINGFDPNDDLDQSDLATAFRNFSPDVGAVFPFDIYYNLYAPDGQVAAFKTTDIVSIFITEDNGVELLNGADIVVPPAMVAQGITEIETASDLNEWYDLMGISDRTVKYRTRSDLINFIMQG